MTENPLHAIERMLERTARSLSGNALHPAEIIQRVTAAVAAAAAGGVAPNRVVLTLNPADHQHFRPAFRLLQREIHRDLDALEAREGLRRIGARQVLLEASRDVPAGIPAVAALFADTASLPSAPTPGATRRLRRAGEAVLVVAGSGPVRRTHTPFSIGRGPANDLVLPSLAVSREHAVVQATETGYELVDCGSRNGLVLRGQRHDRLLLEPGAHVMLGDVELWLEETG